jgi:hypothetical protein
MTCLMKGAVGKKGPGLFAVPIETIFGRGKVRRL